MWWSSTPVTWRTTPLPSGRCLLLFVAASRRRGLPTPTLGLPLVEAVTTFFWTGCYSRRTRCTSCSRNNRLSLRSLSWRACARGVQFSLIEGLPVEGIVAVITRTLGASVQFDCENVYLA
uniref:Putative secreted protein n=1 Tax=Amblyomma tuberculatum TaxID=48802 RepID=A0A6M2E529_9ACAR